MKNRSAVQIFATGLLIAIAWFSGSALLLDDSTMPRDLAVRGDSAFEPKRAHRGRDRGARGRLGRNDFHHKLLDSDQPGIAKDSSPTIATTASIRRDNASIAPPPPWPTTSILGRVIDEAGNPIEGVVARIGFGQAIQSLLEQFPPAAPILSVMTTDAEGRYRIPQVPRMVAAVGITFFADQDSIFHEYTEVYLDDGPVIDAGSFRLLRPRSVSIRGVVRLASGAPARGAAVWATVDASDWARTTTDDDGTFELIGRGLPRLAAIQAMLEFGDGCATFVPADAATFVSIEPSATAAPIEVWLPESSDHSLRFVDDLGAPLANASITITDRGSTAGPKDNRWGQNRPPSVTQKTDSNGIASFSFPHPSYVRVEVESEGLSLRWDGLGDTFERQQLWTVPPPRRFLIRAVDDASGEEIPWATAAFRGTDNPDNKRLLHLFYDLRLSATPGSNEVVARVDTFLLQLGSATHQFPPVRVDPAGDYCQVEVRSTPPVPDPIARLHGTVRRDHGPLCGTATLHVAPSNSTPHDGQTWPAHRQRITLVSEDGTFQISSYHVGSPAFVQVDMADGEIGLSEVFRIPPEGASLDLTIDVASGGGSIVGQLDGFDRSIFPTLRVLARRDDGLIARRSVNEEGTFRIEPLPDGAYDISLLATSPFDAYSFNSSPFRGRHNGPIAVVQAGSTSHLVATPRDFQIGFLGARLSGYPKSTFGNSVYVDRGTAERTLPVDEEGTVPVIPLLAGPALVWACDPTGEPISVERSVTIVPGETTVVEFENTGTSVRGVVLDGLTGLPLSKVYVRFRHYSGDDQDYVSSQSRITQRDGTFSFDCVPTDFEVLVATEEKPPGREVMFPVTLETKRPQFFTVRIEPVGNLELVGDATTLDDLDAIAQPVGIPSDYLAFDRSSDQGPYNMTGLQPGAYEILVFRRRGESGDYESIGTFSVHPNQTTQVRIDK